MAAQATHLDHVLDALALVECRLNGDSEGFSHLLDTGDNRSQAHVLAAMFALYLRAVTADPLEAIAELRPVLMDQD
jgi:hypothetical protein